MLKRINNPFKKTVVNNQTLPIIKYGSEPFGICGCGYNSREDNPYKYDDKPFFAGPKGGNGQNVICPQCNAVYMYSSVGFWNFVCIGAKECIEDN